MTRRYRLHATVSRSMTVGLCQEAMVRQSEIGGVCTILLTSAALGPLLCPMLLFLMPLWAWTNHCVIQWSASQLSLIGSGVAGQQNRSVSEMVVEKILARQPTSVVVVSCHLVSWVIAACVFLDLEFEISPIIFYMFFCVVEVCVLRYCLRASQKHYEPIDFKPVGPIRRVPNSVTFIKF